MKKLTLFAAALFLSASVSATEVTESFDRTYDVRPGARVVLDNVNGAITINSWDQPRVQVVATKKVRGDRDDLAQAMKELKIEVAARDGGLVIDTRYPNERNGIASLFDFLSGDDVNAQVTYQLTVPKSMNLDIDNTNGNIRVTDVRGQLDLDTTNGQIQTIRCAGAIDASTTNGRIEAELLTVAAGRSHSLSTTNGRIVLSVPASFSGEVDAGTTNGAITTDLPIAMTRHEDNHVRGKINGGGALVKLRTTNGGIEIRKN
jgi:Putative adhesin